MFAASSQGEGVLAKSKSQSGLGIVAGLSPHRRAYLWVWILCAGPCFPLAFPSGSWAHTTQNGFLQGDEWLSCSYS